MSLLKAAVAACIALCVSSTWADSPKTTSAKSFHVFIPTDESWRGATPMINEDGKDYEMTFDSEHCGWYYRTYEDGKIPKSVIIHRDDDAMMSEAIGVNGAWEESDSPEPIPMDAMFVVFEGHDDIFFVADADKAADLDNKSAKGWVEYRPDFVGKCSFRLPVLIYDTDASLHGAFSCAPDWAAGQTAEQAHANACYTSGAKFQVVSSANEPYPCSGVTTDMVESRLSIDPVSKTKKMTLTSVGRKCFGANADSAFAAMFRWTENVNEKYCEDVVFDRTSDGKYEFNSDTYLSPGATVPGGFYPAETSPSAAMMLSSSLPAAESKRKAEGPTFFCAEDPHNSDTKTPLGLRTINPAEGFPVSSLICNGPGWSGGVDCNGLFQSGNEFNIEPGSIGQTISKKLGVTWAGDGWGWSCENAAPVGWEYYSPGTEKSVGKKLSDDKIPQGTARWTSGNSDSNILSDAGRNQHFCAESHAMFRYKKGLKFSITGDDDIWVFIDRKLAVDLGGTHLPAPGYVDLDKFLPDAEVGTYYDIDIYFCDRRTTSSNIRITTNMFLDQDGLGLKSGAAIEILSKQDMDDYIKNGNNRLKICYVEYNSNGPCEAALDVKENKWCGKEIISNAHKSVSYEWTTDLSGKSEPVVSGADFAANPIQFNGGIDVTDPTAPIINEDKLKESGIPSGSYYLIVKIGYVSKAIKIAVKSSVGVADRDAIVIDGAGKKLPHAFKSVALASMVDGKGNVDVKQMVPLYIANIFDSCKSDVCEDPLEMQPSANSSYSLETDNPKAVFYEMKNGKLTAFNPSTSRKIGSSGIDTVYVTVPMEELDAAQENVSVNVKGSARKAKLVFFVPQLVFVDSDSTYKVVNADDGTSKRFKGALYELNLVALNVDKSVCTECNFALAKGSRTSVGLDLMAESNVVNGRAKVPFRSSVVYEKCDADSCRGTAMLHIVGPAAHLMQTTYSNMQFKEPPPGRINETKVAYSKSPFDVKKVAPLEFDIVLNGRSASIALQYAVMDMNGQVLMVGTLENANARVKVPTVGSYIVKVGQNYKQVNVK